MEVKFPLTNYMNFLQAQTEAEQAQFKTQFLRDVKGLIQQAMTKDYINPDQNTLDYVLVFIPNENIYAFINQEDHELLEEALKKKRYSTLILAPRLENGKDYFSFCSLYVAIEFANAAALR